MDQAKKGSLVHKILVPLAALLCAAAPVLNYGFRIGYVFIDHEVFPGFAQLLFFVMLANAAYALLYCWRFFNGKPSGKAWKAMFIVSCVLGAFFALVNYINITIAHAGAMWISLRESAFYLFTLLAVFFSLMVFPRLPLAEKTRKITAAVLCAVFLLGMAAPVLLVLPLRFSIASEPVVLDTGTGHYSVVFAGSSSCHGFVNYSYNGEDKTVYSNNEGVRRIGKIHAVLIPREQLENNDYTIGITRVPHHVSYQNSDALGKTVLGETYHFKGEQKQSGLRMLSVSDWHQRMKELAAAAAQFEQPDLFLLLGDYADYYVNEDQVIEYLLRGAAAITASEVPAIFVRGNHEVRGNFDISGLWRTLGLPGYYYQVERGGYIFTVLDSAEGAYYDWEHDGFYDMEPYLSQQLDWLEALPAAEKTHVLLCHDKDFNTEEFGLRERYYGIVNRMAPTVAVSGHSHKLHAVPSEGGQFHFIEDGGRNVENGPASILDIFHPGTHIYECAQITFTGDEIHVLGKDHYGSQTAAYVINEYNQLIVNQG